MSFAATLTEAQRIYLQMRADGQTVDEACRYLEGVLRTTWPRGGTPRSYRCQTCDDLGAIWHACPGLGRSICGRRFPHDGHEFIDPCECEAGRKFRPKERRPEDFTEAGKAPKRSMTRFGR